MKHCTVCFQPGHDVRTCPARVRDVNLRSSTIAMTLVTLVRLMNDYRGRVQAQLVSEDRVAFLFEFTPTERMRLTLPERYGLHALEREGRSLGAASAEVAAGEPVRWRHELNLAKPVPLGVLET